MNIKKYLFICAMILAAIPASAQRRISGTVSDDVDVIIGASVKEVDKNNRILNATVTDYNGNFTMTLKDNKSNLVVKYIGYKEAVVPTAGKTVFKIHLSDNTKTLKDVVITRKKMTNTGGLTIPEKEYGGAVQSFSFDNVEGLSFESADQALQGEIAGLDIVQNSGNLGSGTQMRLRGVSSIHGDSQPLIVVDGHPLRSGEDYNQDAAIGDYDSEEQFADLLNVNTEDILDIQVCKDAVSCAEWGSDGANGVIKIKTRRGKRQPTKVNFSYKFSGSWQGDGYSLLDGDGYTMYMKESYYNPAGKQYNIPELNYLPSNGSIYTHYSGNTDWLKEVTKFGQKHSWYVTLTGGGEKANFRISAGYDRSLGTIINQSMDQFTTRTNLDYWVSDRIKFSASVNMSYTGKSNCTSNPVYGYAQAAMPNMSVYKNNDPSQGYFIMLPAQSAYTEETEMNKTSYYITLDGIYSNGNPVAYGYGYSKKDRQNVLTPQFDLTYKLLGKESGQWQLNYRGDVQLNATNTSSDLYVPAYLKNADWNGSSRNSLSNNETKYFSFTTDHKLEFYSGFKNQDHTLSGSADFYMTTSNTSYQSISSWNAPTGISDPTVTAVPSSASSSTSYSRSNMFRFQIHYSYKSIYAIGGNLNLNGSSAFGDSNKYQPYGGVYGTWNIADETWMKWSRKVLSTLRVRASYGITGSSGAIPNGSQYTKYSDLGSSYNGTKATIPNNLALSTLRPEKTKEFNLGFNVGFMDDMFNFDINYYNRAITDMMMYTYGIQSANGFSSISCVNAGRMRNQGWELNFSTGEFAKFGKFKMKLRGNLAQNINLVEEMDKQLLDAQNNATTIVQPTNQNYSAQKRIQLGNALGSIYGLEYEGVYRYDYDHNGYSRTSFETYGSTEVDKDGNVVTFATASEGTGYDAKGNAINTAAAAERRGESNISSPIVRDADGNIMYDRKGNPLKMYYTYDTNANGSRLEFRGGDVIYKDQNHDGSIDRYDVVYLGNSNVKLQGGFGINLYYGDFSLNTSFTFRVGNKVINAARMEYESMTNNYNQSTATYWRWRKNGDDTDIPRALNSHVNTNTAFNALPSSRYVEDGDYIRCKYIQISYSFNPKKMPWMKKCGLSSLKLHASMNNIFCITKYTGIDPEIAVGGLGVATDTQKTPIAKSFTCDVNIGF